MKIRMKLTDGKYAIGEVYDFPDDVALRWIAEGKAMPVAERKARKPEPDKDEGD